MDYSGNPMNYSGTSWSPPAVHLLIKTKWCILICGGIQNVHTSQGAAAIPFRYIPYVPQFFVSCLFTLFPFNVSTNVMKCTKQEYGTPHKNICSPQHNIPSHWLHTLLISYSQSHFNYFWTWIIIGGYGNVNWTNEQHNVQNKKITQHELMQILWLWKHHVAFENLHFL